MEICPNKSCEIRFCPLRHPKSCRYFKEIGYCKFGEWCFFKHEDINRREMEEVLEKMDAKMDDFKNDLQLLKKQVILLIGLEINLKI